MGVPSYFKNIIQKYNNILIIKEEFHYEVNNLFFDLNCLIHPCCRNLTNENEMYDKIYEYILHIINITNVKNLIYIAIDGVCPRAKIEQQKSRRFKSANENKIWDTNAITPGTNFMNKLDIFLKGKNYPIKVIFSGSNEPGEGEHKIMHYLKNNYNNDDINIVYGLDADLIHLSLIKQNNIYLLRERTEFNFERAETDFIFLDINNFKKYLIQDIKKDYKIDNQTCINDYVFLCFFVGNDFIHNIISINIRYGGLEYLLDTYNICQGDYSGYFYLINENKLDLKIFYIFVKINNGNILIFFQKFIKIIKITI
jgi:5'-3' exonuclease